MALVRRLGHVQAEQAVEANRRRHVGDGDPDRVQVRHDPSVLEDDRDRPVVDELDGHACAEEAGRDAHALLAERLAEGLVERLGLVGRRCLGEARPVALRA